MILKSNFRFSFETFYYRYKTTLKSYPEMVLDDIKDENINQILYFVFSNLTVKVLKLQIKISLSKLSLPKKTAAVSSYLWGTDAIIMVLK